MKETRNRIGSIDALRAFALLGILLVHTAQLYCFYNSYNNLFYFSETGTTIQNIIFQYGRGRFVILFSILFGTSFYLILRNPNYSQKKFLWRCLILICFGLFNKLFYTPDILLWYGINGIVLSFFPVRKMPSSAILGMSIFFYVLYFFININMDNYILSDEQYSMRYQFSKGVQGIFSYPYLDALKETVLVFKSSRTMTLSYFFLGFYLGRIGIFDRLHLFNLKTISFLVGFAGLTLLIYKYFNYSPEVRNLYYLATAILYASVFLYAYRYINGKMSLMRDYGRLGLTNYSLQNILFPMIIPLIIYPAKLSFEYIVLISLAFFAIQLYFSRWWLKTHKYGPFEHLWRMFTERRIIPNY